MHKDLKIHIIKLLKLESRYDNGEITDSDITIKVLNDFGFYMYTISYWVNENHSLIITDKINIQDFNKMMRSKKLKNLKEYEAKYV